MNYQHESLALKKRYYEEIELSKLRIGPNQMRRKDADQGVLQLSESIDKMGLLEPIIVSKIEGEDAELYEVIAGQRRFLACSSLDWKKIPCMVFEQPIVKSIDSLALSISENVMRHEPAERDLIDACTKLYNHYGTLQLVSEETGLPVPKVSRYVKAARLSEHLKRMVDDGSISLKAALSAEDASIENSAVAEKIAEKMSEEKMGPTNAEAFAKRVKKLVQEKGGHNISIEDLDTLANDKNLSEVSVSVKLPQEIDRGLDNFAETSGTNKSNAVRNLIVDGLVSKGYVEETQ